MVDDGLHISTDWLKKKLYEIREELEQRGQSTFTTADVIRKYSGRYCTNTIIPAVYSLNAEFGRYLGRNSVKLGIELTGRELSVEDDLGQPSTAAEWRFLKGY
jgi:hypothetical protein